METYCDKNGKPHRENGPAETWWHLNGEKEYEVYYKNGNRHRENGPAYIQWYEDGEKEYGLFALMLI